MKTVFSKTVPVLTAVLLAGACANNSATHYTSTQAQNVSRVYYGQVLSVTPVHIKGENNPLVTAAGAALGGIGGSHVGKGRGAAVGAILGALAGGFAAQGVTGLADGQQGVEIVVQLDNRNEAISVVQKADMVFQPGQRVRVLSGSNGVTRILPL